MDDRVVKRQLSNFLLQPLLQTKIGLYCIGLSLVFGACVVSILYVNLSQLYSFIIALTDAPEEVETIILNYLSSLQNWIYLSIGTYIGTVVAVSIWYTHRLVGPMVAFKRHFEALDAGDFSHRTVLRKGDAFHEAANTLNQATVSLENRVREAASREVS